LGNAWNAVTKKNDRSERLMQQNRKVRKEQTLISAVLVYVVRIVRTLNY
jgi:hypothetical protein